MKKFEYLVEDIAYGPYLEDRLNNLGSEGWELVNITPVEKSTGVLSTSTFHRAIFKRSLN